MSDLQSYPETAPADVITVTPQEASRRTGIPEQTIRKAMASRELGYFDFNRKVRVISLDELNRWLNEHRVGSNAPVAAAVRNHPPRPPVGRMTLRKHATLARAKKAFRSLTS